MNGATPLLDAALARLAGHFATRTIPASLRAPDYDRAFGERVCRLVARLNEARGSSFDRAVDAFVTGCAETLRQQRALERTGRYACPSFAHAKRTVYDDDVLMSTTYLDALLLSQALWIHHHRIFDHFRRCFAAPARLGSPAGRVLEVPLGTGLFLSELTQRNPGWSAVGVDLSAASTRYAAELMRHDGGRAVLRQGDVFDEPTDRVYDRIVCGELLEHVDEPARLLDVLAGLLAPHGRIFLTTAIWAASPDHVHLFECADDVREMLGRRFAITDELVLPVEPGASPNAHRIPMSYACVLAEPSMMA